MGLLKRKKPEIKKISYEEHPQFEQRAQELPPLPPAPTPKVEEKLEYSVKRISTREEQYIADPEGNPVSIEQLMVDIANELMALRDKIE